MSFKSGLEISRLKSGDYLVGTATATSSAADVIPDRPRRPELPGLEHLASGSQAHVFCPPGGNWVIKFPRFTALSLLAVYVRVPGYRQAMDSIQQTLGGLVMPFVHLEGVAFRADRVFGLWDKGRAISGTKRVYQGSAILMPRVADGALLERQLENGTAAEVVAGLESMLALLEQLAAHGYYMLDFVMKNFAWHAGQLRILDVDLLIPVDWVTNMHFAPVAYFFRRGLLRDYLRIIRQAQARAGADSAACLRLEHLASEFPRRIHALARPRPSQPARSVLSTGPVTPPVDLMAEAMQLLGASAKPARHEYPRL